ncbi:MAG: hypothetical protein ACYDCG_05685 [Candidatus Acidiferrales bacterium]
MLKLIRIHGWALLALISCAPLAQAQGTGPAKPESGEQPVAPYTPPLPAGSTSLLALGTSGEVQGPPDDRPLSGVQQQTLGPNSGASNFLAPSFSAMSQLATNSFGPGSGGPTDFNYLLGTLDLNRASDRSELLVHYTGGGMFSSYFNSAIQDLEFSYNFKWQRWSLLVGDGVSYLSESPFGFGGVGGLDFLSGNSPFGPGGFLSSILGPNQTIPTIMVPRVSNTAISQIEYKLSPRASWTASGSYATLDFLGVGYINSAEALFQTGYNYSLNPRSSIAVIYRFDDFRFTQLPQVIENHVVQLGYERNVTGRLNWHVAAGPSVVMLRGALTGYGNQVSWALDAALDYKMNRTTILLSYDHLVTGGGGVLVGAQTGLVQATIDRKLSPRWQGSASLGYATSGSLIPLSANLANERLSSWYAVARLDHQFRPGTAFFVSYEAQLQAVNTGACTTPNCGTNTITHEISVGFNFGLRPISMR